MWQKGYCVCLLNRSRFFGIQFASQYALRASSPGISAYSKVAQWWSARLLSGGMWVASQHALRATNPTLGADWGLLSNGKISLLHSEDKGSIPLDSTHSGIAQW